MASKFCRECRSTVPAGEWPAHQRRHRDAKSERKGGSRPWRRLCEAVKARDGQKCTVCGATEDLEVHHVDGDWRNEAMSNLATVCFAHNPRGRGRNPAY